MRRILPLLLLMTLASTAQSAEAEFTVKLRSFTVGTFHLSSSQNTTSYSASTRIKDAGLLGVFRSFYFNATSRGTLRDASLTPAHYVEDADTGRRASKVTLDYQRGVPRVTTYASTTPAAANAPDPATQGGTFDPATTLYALFRDQPADTACNTKIVIYDGMRRSHLVLQKPRLEGGALRCRGEYRRLQGFTPKELERNVAFPLDLTFANAGDGMVHVARVEITSSYGLATLDRR